MQTKLGVRARTQDIKLTLTIAQLEIPLSRSVQESSLSRQTHTHS